MMEIAQDVKELVCFQRFSQYSALSGDESVDPEYRERVHKNYNAIFEQQIQNSAVGFGPDESTQLTMSVSAEVREEIFRRLVAERNRFDNSLGVYVDFR
jgi:hypothetical protein